VLRDQRLNFETRPDTFGRPAFSPRPPGRPRDSDPSAEPLPDAPHERTAPWTVRLWCLGQFDPRSGRHRRAPSPTAP